MRFQIITLFPEMMTHAASFGVLGQGIKKNLLQMRTVQPREFATDAHRTVDDRPYGGGDGMIMKPDILQACIESVRPTRRVIYLSPQGPVLTTEKAQELAALEDVTLICGRYGGVDERVLATSVDEEISIGDYVLSGGEFAALVVMDAVSRFVPGVLGHSASAGTDSFSDGLLEWPQFTRPPEWQGMAVPEVLLSGHHDQIQAWREKLALLVTLKKRPRLLGARGAVDFKGLEAFWNTLSPEVKKACGIENMVFPHPSKN